MLTTQDKQDLTVKIDAYNKELRELRGNLNQLNDQKNALSGDRSQVGRKIADLIRQAKKLRRERDELTKGVREHKTERDKLNSEIHRRIEEIRKKSADKKVTRESGPQENPRILEKQIERLQYKLETEVVDFKAEQKLMKQVKELQRRLDAAKSARNAFANVAGVGKDQGSRSAQGAAHRNACADAHKRQPIRYFQNPQKGEEPCVRKGRSARATGHYHPKGSDTIRAWSNHL